jgi:hypothetical protein
MFRLPGGTWCSRLTAEGNDLPSEYDDVLCARFRLTQSTPHVRSIEPVHCAGFFFIANF